MKDDYLWDRSGEVDADVERLERTLQPLRHVETPLPRARSRFAPMRLAAAAAIVLLVAGAWRLAARDDDRSGAGAGDSYAVDGLPGRERAFVGEEITAPGDAAAEMAIGDIGRVALDPGARVRVDAASDRDHRLFLVRGGVDAFIGLEGANRFRIGSPAGMSVDLGCEYRMEVDADGVTRVVVRLGQVAFEAEGRRVIVPAGAACHTRPGERPSTPLWTDFSLPGYREALAAVDGSSAPPASAVAMVLGVTEPRDTLMLWHLLDSPFDELRRAAFRRLRELVELPPSIDEAGVLAGRASSREDLKDELRWFWR